MSKISYIAFIISLLSVGQLVAQPAFDGNPSVANGTSNTIDLSVQLDSDVTIYYVVTKEGDITDTPSSSDVINANGVFDADDISGHFSYVTTDGQKQESIDISSFASDYSGFDIFVIGVSLSNEETTVEKINLIAPPTFLSTTLIGHGAEVGTLTLTAELNVDVVVYYVIREVGSDTPSQDEIVSGAGGFDTDDLLGNVAYGIGDDPKIIDISALPSTYSAYDIYLVGVNVNNEKTEVQELTLGALPSFTEGPTISQEENGTSFGFTRALNTGGRIYYVVTEAGVVPNNTTIPTSDVKFANNVFDNIPKVTGNFQWNIGDSNTGNVDVTSIEDFLLFDIYVVAENSEGFTSVVKLSNQTLRNNVSPVPVALTLCAGANQFTEIPNIVISEGHKRNFKPGTRKLVLQLSNGFVFNNEVSSASSILDLGNTNDFGQVFNFDVRYSNGDSRLEIIFDVDQQDVLDELILKNLEVRSTGGQTNGRLYYIYNSFEMIKVEAENFTSGQSNRVENCGDAVYNGCKNLKNVQRDDLFTYNNIYFPKGGGYTIIFNASAWDDDAEFDLVLRNVDTNTEKRVTLSDFKPASQSGLYNWKDFSRTVNIDAAGTYTVEIEVINDGWNLNWFSLESSAGTGGDFLLRGVDQGANGFAFANFTTETAPEVNIEASEINICEGESITFTATSDDDTSFDFYEVGNDTPLAQNVAEYITDELSEGRHEIYAASTSTLCVGTSDPVEVDVTKVVALEDVRINLENEFLNTTVNEHNERITVYPNNAGLIKLIPEDISGGSITGTFSCASPYENAIVEIEGEIYFSTQEVGNIDALFYIYFEQSCGSVFRFLLDPYNSNSAEQITGITGGVICSNITEPVEIGWIGENIERVSLSNMTSQNITGAIVADFDEEGKRLYYIVPEAIAGTEEATLIVDIEYLVKIEDKEEVNTAVQTINIVNERNISITVGANEALNSSYCQGELISLLGNPQAESFSVIDNATGQEIALPNNVQFMYFEDVNNVDEVEGPTGNLTADNYFPPSEDGYDITMTFTSKQGCYSEETAHIDVNELPEALLDTTLAYCVGTSERGRIAALHLEQADTIPNPQDYSLSWYDENDIFQEETWLYNSGVSDLIATEELFKVRLLDKTIHCYSEASNVSVVVGEYPIVDFIASDVCDYLQYVTLKDRSEAPTTEHRDELVKWSWDYDFGDAIHEYDDNNDQPVQFPESKVYNIKHSATTRSGCADTVSKRVAIFEPVELVEEAGNKVYKEDFDGVKNWISTFETDNANGEARNSSWSLGDKFGSTAWVTNNLEGTFNNNESSWVESPCVDLDDWEAPLLEMKVWYNTPLLEGAVLQYKLQMDDTEWQRVGEQERGLNWYSESSISASPGGSIIGWAGVSDESKWVTAAFDLSEPKKVAKDSADRAHLGSVPVKFRVAFASLNLGAGARDGETGYGFAFDDVVIKNKTRNVLIEHFTNVTQGNDINSERDAVDQFTKDNTGIVYIQYHTHEGEDPFYYNEYFPKNMDNDHLTRRYFYGLGGPGYTIVNGELLDTNYFSTGWGVKQYSREALMASPFDVNIDYEKDNNGFVHVSANAVRNINPHDLLDTWDGNLTMMLTVAVVKKEVEYQGKIMKNVFVKYLPYMGGASKVGTWEAGSGAELMLDATWKPLMDIESGDYSLIGMVQYTHGPTLNKYGYPIKEVLQVRETSLDISARKAAVTGIAPDLLGESVVIYPNPANDEIKVEKITGFISKDAKVQLYNSLGVFLDEYDLSQVVTSIPLSDYTSGVYIMKIHDKGQTSIRKFNVLK